MIKTFLNKNWKGLAILLAAALLILWNVHMFRQNWVNEKKAQVAEYNLQVAQDTIRAVKDRQGRVEYDKLAYLTNSVKNLEKLNSDLAAEVKSIKGNVTTIIKGDIKVVHDTVPLIVKAELIDSNVIAHFNYDTTYSPGNYRKLTGYTKYDLKTGSVSGQKEVDETGISFTTGIKNLDKGKPEIFLKSNYPGFQVTSLQGAELDPKLFTPKKKVPLITPTLFVGWTPVNVNSKDQIVKIAPGQFSAGVGLGFNLFKVFGIKK
jgi:type II secretory pathway pseudopilin PulG